MGTRADFYIGRGRAAVWIGSIAMDGYPDGNPNPLLRINDEDTFREKVAEVIARVGHGTRPEQGWPWPWENSDTTDYAYAFDDGKVYGTCFGHGWWLAHEGESHDHDQPKEIEWPTMNTARTAPPGSDRSGVMVLSFPQKQQPNE